MKRAALTRKLEPSINPLLMHWARLERIADPSPATQGELATIRRIANEQF